MKMNAFLFAAGALLALPATANAQTAPNGALTITFSQSGGNVVASAAGFLKTAGLTVVDFSSPAPAVYASTASTITGNGGFAVFATALTGPSTFGPGGFFAASNAAGPSVGFNFTTQRLFAPTGYTSGDTVASSATYTGAPLASLGLTAGTYTYMSSQNAITVQIGPVAAGALPEPATWAMMLGGFGAAGFAMRRRRNTMRVSFAG